jgi:hypothetical protein
MRTRQQRYLHEQLELIPRPQGFHRFLISRLRSGIATLQNWIGPWLEGDRPPIVREVTTRKGLTQYRVYDSLGDRTLTFDSPQDVVHWLETRHDRKP